MSFYDIKSVWEYKHLLQIAKDQKPYRGSNKEQPKYPLGNRRYSDRYFKPCIDLLDKDEQRDIKASEDPKAWMYFGTPIEIYYTDAYRLGTFYKDSTFEFNPSADGYNQGDTGIMSSVLPGFLYSKVGYGGAVFRHRQTKTEVPVYQGLRIRLCDGRPTEDFEMHVYTLDRKKTKVYREAHDGMFKNGLFMLKAMGVENIFEELKQIALGKITLPVDYKHEDLFKSYDHNDAAGAILSLALRYNINDCKYQFSYSNSWGYQRFLSSLGPEPLVRSVKNYFYTEVYNEAISRKEEVLQTKIYKFGDKLPTTAWGHKIFVNGVERKRII